MNILFIKLFFVRFVVSEILRVSEFGYVRRTSSIFVYVPLHICRLQAIAYIFLTI